MKKPTKRKPKPKRRPVRGVTHRTLSDGINALRRHKGEWDE